MSLEPEGLLVDKFPYTNVSSLVGSLGVHVVDIQPHIGLAVVLGLCESLIENTGLVSESSSCKWPVG